MSDGQYIALKNWCKLKSEIADLKQKQILFQEKEVWWVHVGMNIGHEIYGKGNAFTRPVIILKKINSYSFIGIPLTSKERKGSWYFAIVIKGVPNTAILSQIRIFALERLQRRICSVRSNHFDLLKQKLKDFLELL